LIVLNTALVQLCEFFIWLSVEEKPDLARFDTCPLANKVATIGVFLVGFSAWPLIINAWGFWSSDGENERFRITLVLGLLVSLGYCVAMVLGEARWNPPATLGYKSGVGLPETGIEELWALEDLEQWGTCSYHNPAGRHPVHWRFHILTISWLPGYFSWNTLVLIPVLFYLPRFSAWSFFSVGTLTYIIPRMFLPIEETMSMY